jgi:glycosyltransferase involved in cell wall biosynthesis
MKKILIITSYYLPGYKAGGPIKSILNLVENLKDNFNITVLTSDRDFKDIKQYPDIMPNKRIDFKCYGVVYLSHISTISIYRQIKLLKPDIVYLNSFFSKFTQISLLLKKLNLIESSIILAPRGELSHGALSLKPVKKNIFLKIAQLTNLYSKNIIFHATDATEEKDIKKNFSNELINIPNLISRLDMPHENTQKVTGKLKIVFLSRISAKKNLLYALETLRGIDNEGIIFDIFGIKEDVSYWEKCEKIISSYKNIVASYKGVVNPAHVPELLSQYHVFFLPTKNENFGHAIVEAMQSSLIPVISDQTPWSDLGRYKAGYPINLSNKIGFINAFNELLQLNQNEFSLKLANVKKYVANNKQLNNKKNLVEYMKLFKER